MANKNVRYFGTHRPKYPVGSGSGGGGGGTQKVCRSLPEPFLLSPNDQKIFNDAKPPDVQKFLTNKANEGIRCPCPALASTLPPENRTVDPARVRIDLLNSNFRILKSSIN